MVVVSDSPGRDSGASTCQDRSGLGGGTGGGYCGTSSAAAEGVRGDPGPVPADGGDGCADGGMGVGTGGSPEGREDSK